MPQNWFKTAFVGSLLWSYPSLGSANPDHSDALRRRSSGGNEDRGWQTKIYTTEVSQQARAEVPTGNTSEARRIARATSIGGDYTRQQFDADLSAVLQSRSPRISNRNLGNPSNLNMWSLTKRIELYSGIRTAQRLFFPEFSIETLSHLVLAEGAQESTGDFSLGVRAVDFNDHSSQGLMQVTPATVLLDYKNHGQAIKSLNGNILLDPDDAGQLSLANPRTSVLLWAWYTSNCVKMGVSMNEWVHRREWNIRTGTVPRDFGNAQLTWLAGPHNDRRNKAEAYRDYHDRIADYFVQSGFGDAGEFERLLDTRLEGGVKLVQEIEAEA